MERTISPAQIEIALKFTEHNKKLREDMMREPVYLNDELRFNFLNHYSKI